MLSNLQNASMQSVLAVIVILGGYLFLAFIPTTDVIKTTITNMMILVLGFYFGSSATGIKKDETIAGQLAEKK